MGGGGGVNRCCFISQPKNHCGLVGRDDITSINNCYSSDKIEMAVSAVEELKSICWNRRRRSGFGRDESELLLVARNLPVVNNGCCRERTMV